MGRQLWCFSILVSLVQAVSIVFFLFISYLSIPTAPCGIKVGYIQISTYGSFKRRNIELMLENDIFVARPRNEERREEYDHERGNDESVLRGQRAEDYDLFTKFVAELEDTASMHFFAENELQQLFGRSRRLLK